MKLGRLLSHGGNLRILLVSQMGGAKWLAVTPFIVAPGRIFTYMVVICI